MIDFLKNNKIRKEIRTELNNAPVGTDELVLLSNIRIPFNFKQTDPQHAKILRKLKDYNENNYTLREPISVVPLYNNDDGTKNGYYMLKDNYIGYIILLFNNKTYAPISYYEECETMCN